MCRLYGNILLFFYKGLEHPETLVSAGIHMNWKEVECSSKACTDFSGAFCYFLLLYGLRFCRQCYTWCVDFRFAVLPYPFGKSGTPWVFELRCSGKGLVYALSSFCPSICLSIHLPGFYHLSSVSYLSSLYILHSVSIHLFTHKSVCLS